MARQVVAQTIMDEIGWSNRYAVPVANAENKRLEGEVRRLRIAQLFNSGKENLDDCYYYYYLSI